MNKDTRVTIHCEGAEACPWNRRQEGEDYESSRVARNIAKSHAEHTGHEVELRICRVERLGGED